MLHPAVVRHWKTCTSTECGVDCISQLDVAAVQLHWCLLGAWHMLHCISHKHVWPQPV